MGAGDREQGNIPGSLDGFCYLSLMLGAVAGNSAWNYLAALSDEVTKCAWILVVDGYLFIGAEAADLPALKWSFLSWPARAL